MKTSRVVKIAHRLAKPYRITDGKGFKLKDVDPGDTGDLKDADKPRANEVEVVLNGELVLKLVMENDAQLKSSLELPPRTPVRTLELRVKSVFGGRLGAATPGFAEIELVGAR